MLKNWHLEQVPVVELGEPNHSPPNLFLHTCVHAQLTDCRDFWSFLADIPAAQLQSFWVRCVYFPYWEEENWIYLSFFFVGQVEARISIPATHLLVLNTLNFPSCWLTSMMHCFHVLSLLLRTKNQLFCFICLPCPCLPWAWSHWVITKMPMTENKKKLSDRKALPPCKWGQENSRLHPTLPKHRILSARGFAITTPPPSGLQTC